MTTFHSIPLYKISVFICHKLFSNVEKKLNLTAYFIYLGASQKCVNKMKNSFLTRIINSDYDHFSFCSVAQKKCVYMAQVVFKCRIKMKSHRVFHLFRCVTKVCKSNEKQLLDT